MADNKPRQRGLGRGLSALMADVSGNAGGETTSRRPDLMVPIEKITPNPNQPRRHFDKGALDDLSVSIREKGIIQPLIVRPKEDGYEIVAGERRWRAAQLAKLHEVPVLVREFDDIEVLEIAIIENIQRADLNPIEEAAGYSQLMEKFGHTQEKLAEVLGKSRSHIANCVRLLQLPQEVCDYLRDGALSSGHARALITSDDPVSLAKQVVQKGLSVRETERLAKAATVNIFSDETKKRREGSIEKDADTKALENDLSANLGMKVSIDHKPDQEKGSLTVRYDTLDQLDAICRLLSANA